MFHLFIMNQVFPPIPCDYSLKDNSSFPFEDRCSKLKEGLKKCPSYVHPLEVVLHMEGSGKWPDCLKAVQRVKAALHLELAGALSKELGLPALPSTTHLDVLKDDYVFRLKLTSRKELVLLKQVVSTEGAIKIKETEQYHELNLITELLPQLSSIMHGIQQQFPVFGVTCRLAKRWVASHLLLDLHLPQVCVELLVAFLFLHSGPMSPPSSPVSGFIRFLWLLSTHDWKTAPLIVNLNQDFKKEDMNEIQSHFTSQRPVLPAMFLATPLDRTSSVWTRKLPTGPVLRRLASLAQASVRVLQDGLQCLEEAKFHMLFTPSLDMYDVLIYLRPRQLPKKYQSVTASFEYPRELLDHPEDRHGKRIFPVVGFDPVQCYLKELKNSFEEFALFFHDIFGGQVIGVLWKPQAFEPKPFKVSQVKCRKEGPALTSGGKSVIPNVEAILENFAILGTGLVQRIQTKSEKWDIA